MYLRGVLNIDGMRNVLCCCYVVIHDDGDDEDNDDLIVSPMMAVSKEMACELTLST